MMLPMNRHGSASPGAPSRGGWCLLSIGDQVRPAAYRFHSRFNRVVNFECNGRLLSIVDEPIGPGPLNIVFRASGVSQKRLPDGQSSKAAEDCGSPLVLRAGYGICVLSQSPLKIDANTVCFAGHRFRFTDCQRYDSMLAAGPANLSRFEHSLPVLAESLQQDAPPKSLAFLLDARRARYFQTAFERAFIEQVRRGVREVFRGRLLAGIRDLKGCGPGLTPSGDDFIAGLLVGLNLLQKLRGQDLQPVADAVFRATQGANIFSNTFLDLARRGLLFGRLKGLLVALLSGTKLAVRSTARELFALGGTSGADLATGFLMTARDQAAATNRWRKLGAPGVQEN